MLLGCSREAGCDVGRPRPRAATTRRRSRPCCAQRPPTCDADRHERRREHGRLRRRQGGARPHRRHALDADRDQAGQAVRVRPARRRRRPRAGVRAARQPGLLARELRAVRPPGAAPDDGPPPPRPPERRRRRRRRPAPPARRQDAPRAGARPRSAPTAGVHVALDRRPGQPPARRDRGGQRARRARRRRRRRRRRRGRASLMLSGSIVAWRRSIAAARAPMPPRPGARAIRASLPCARRPRRPLRAHHPRPAHLGHRPLQLPLHVLHAGGGHEVAAARGAAHVRGDRAPGPDLSSSASASTAIRLTGGEPTVRAHLAVLVGQARRAAHDRRPDRSTWRSPPTAPRLRLLAARAARAPACDGSTSASTRSTASGSRR